LFVAVTALSWADDLPLEPLRIGKITTERKNVFESGHPREQRFPYSWANKLHFVTHERFIQDEILFKPGDCYDPNIIKESERVLRARPVFRYVSIEPQPPVNGVVDVIIKTEDVWSTAVQLGYGVAGGKTFYRLGINEQNLFGSGRRAGAFVKQDIDRFVRGFTFLDPHVFRSRWEFFGGFGKDEKGKEWETHLERPHYSALTRHSEGGAYSFSEDEDRLFENGDEIANFDHETKAYRVFYSYALKPSLVRIRRLSLAFERKDDTFTDIHVPTRLAAPHDRTTSALLAGFDYKNVRFVKERGVRTFDRDEDLNKGLEVYAEAGPSFESWGATRDGLLGRIKVNKIWNPRARQYVITTMGADGRIEQRAVQDGILKLGIHYTSVDWQPGHTGVLRTQVELGRNLDEETQLLLGGENGLRGYSVRQFSGSKKVLFNVENRQVLLYDLWQLMNLGWAVFSDTGAVWKESEQVQWRNFRSDVGVGLRIAPSRSTDPSLIRMDVAYALQDNQRSSRFVVNIGADFSFNLAREKKFDQ
jgi:hypothetical protein